MKDYEAFGAICTILGALLLLAVCLFAGCWIALWLWNIIAIPIFGAPVLSFWQMYGLMWLLRLLIPGRGVSVKKDN